jgi:hypothetical protein
MNERSSCYLSTSIRSFALFIAALPQEGKEEDVFSVTYSFLFSYLGKEDSSRKHWVGFGGNIE